MTETKEPHIIITRDLYVTGLTGGVLRTTDKPVKLYTCEDQSRAPGVKVPGETCIPAGIYRFRTAPSPKLNGRVVIWIDGVPGFDAIQIHKGNTPKDLRGCVAPGLKRGLNGVLSSGAALDILMANIGALSRSGAYIAGVKGTIEIRDTPDKLAAFLAQEAKPVC